MVTVLVSHFKSREIVDPRNLKVSTAVTVLLVMVIGDSHLHSFELVQLQIVLTTPADQPFNLLSVSSLVTVVEEADDRCVICKLQEFYRRSLEV